MGSCWLRGAWYFFQQQISADSRSSRDRDDDEEREDDDDSRDDEEAREDDDDGPRRVVLRQADEVDDPTDFDYLDTRPDCSEYRRLTDPVKEIGDRLSELAEAATEVSFEEERRYGDQWLNELTTAFGGTLEHEGTTIDYIEGVVAPMMDHLIRDDTRYDFHLLHGSGIENALALPGGHIVITNELMNNWIENEAQLATVLGHEIAHVEHRHTAAMIGYARSLGMDPNDALTQIIVNIGTAPFNSIQEEEADRTGARIIHSVGYSIFQSVRMWEMVEEREGGDVSAPGSQASDPFSILASAVLNEIENVFTTHPNPGKRACLLRQIAHDRYAEDPLEEAYRGETNWLRKEPMSEEQY